MGPRAVRKTSPPPRFEPRAFQLVRYPGPPWVGVRIKKRQNKNAVEQSVNILAVLSFSGQVTRGLHNPEIC